MTAHASSTALVEIERPGRWGKQLASHLGRRHGGEWSEESASGWVDFDGARAALAAEGGGLRLVVEAPASCLAGSPESVDPVTQIRAGRHQSLGPVQQGGHSSPS